MAREMVEQLEFERQIISYIVENINNLSEESIATIISFTTPRDACRVATLSSNFNEAANSNVVWNRFLPFDYREMILRSSNIDDVHMLDTLSKKELFMYLADNSLLIDEGLMSFSLEKSSGKKCYTLAARKLDITWGDTPTYWQWLTHFEPQSRFAEVARLEYVWWLEINARITTSMLSPNTRYGAYLVFDVTSNVWKFYDLPIDVAVETSGGEEVVTGRVYLDPRRAGIFDREYDLVASFDDEGPEENVKLPNKRKDGWLEVEIGVFFTREEDEHVMFSLMEVKAGIAKGGLVVEGIEIRPIIE